MAGRDDSQQQVPSRRSSKACARCKRRKTKCDFKYPSCTACRRAGVDCHGYNASGAADVPRSLVRYLEDRVAELESRAATLHTSSASVTKIFKAKSASATLSFGIKSPRSFFSSKISPVLFFRSSCPPLAVSRSKTDVLECDSQDPTQKLSLPRIHQGTNLKTVPRAAIEHMIRNYTEIHLPQYPCISEKWLYDVQDRVLSEHDGDTEAVLAHGISTESGLTHFDYFVTFITLAISSLTLTWRAEHQARTASNSFFSAALCHLHLMVDVDEIQILQASLLLAHFAHMNPDKVDNWACITNAVNIVLELGLHTRFSRSKDAQQARQHCRLFWVTYGMERSLCGILRLPLSFPEDSITMELDYANADDNLEDAMNDALLKQSSANHIYLLRGLESEVHRVLYLQEEMTQGPLDLHEWLGDITNRLEVWHERAKEFSRHQMLEFRNVQYAHLKARIYRPTPRIRIRTQEDRIKSLSACQMLIDDYQGQVKSRRLFYPWHGVHILYEATTIMLDSCWCSRDCLPMRHQARYVLSVTIPDCLALLVKVGERWHEAQRCVKYLRPIVEEVVKVFNDRLLNDVDPACQTKEASITSTLEQLLFPEGPIMWTSGASVASVEEMDVDGMLDTVTGTPLLHEFGWDADWVLDDIFSDSLVY